MAQPLASDYERLTLPALQVAIFGGDDRLYSLEHRYNGGDKKTWEGIEVSAYPSSESNARSLGTALRKGSYAHVVVLTRWMGHVNYTSIREAAKAGGARLWHWERGLGLLEDKLVDLVQGKFGDNSTGAPTGAEEDAPEERPIHLQARDAGLTVACFQERHDECAYKGKTVVRCGCSCHPVSPEEQARREEAERIARENEEFSPSADDVVTAMNIDPSHADWRISEIADLLLANTKEKRDKVQNLIALMVQHNELLELENHHIMLPKAATITPPPVPVAPPSTNYAVLLPASPEWRSLYAGSDKEEALAALARNPGAQLFKSVKVRIRYEIEE